MSEPNDRRTMTLDEFGDAMGVSRPVIYREANDDALPVPVIRIGTRMVVSRDAVDELLARRKIDEYAAEINNRLFQVGYEAGRLSVETEPPPHDEPTTP